MNKKKGFCDLYYCRQSPAIGKTKAGDGSDSIQNFAGGSSQQSGCKNASLRPLFKAQRRQDIFHFRPYSSTTSNQLPRVSKYCVIHSILTTLNRNLKPKKNGSECKPKVRRKARLGQKLIQKLSEGLYVNGLSLCS